MFESKCRGAHSDSQKSTYKDSADRAWVENECRHCGRLERKLK